MPAPRRQACAAEIDFFAAEAFDQAAGGVLSTSKPGYGASPGISGDCDLQTVETKITLTGSDAVYSSVSKSLTVSGVAEEGCTPELAEQKAAEIVNCTKVTKVTLKKVN